MGGGEFLDVQTVGEDTVWLPLQQVLTLISCDVGDSGEDVGRVGCSALNAVSVVDTTLSSFGIHVKVLQVVVEIYGSSAKISAEESSVGGKYGGNINATLLAEGKRDTG